MKASSKKEAWKIAQTIFRSDYRQDMAASDRAGYPIYRSTEAGNFSYICDLHERLEINFDNGETVNIWIHEDPYTLQLDRLEVCDLLLATMGIFLDAERELVDPETAEGRRQVLRGTIRKWKALHDRIEFQLDAIDAARI